MSKRTFDFNNFWFVISSDLRRREHLVAEAINEQPAPFSFLHESGFLPINDYMILFVRMAEAMLSNSTVMESAAAMIEAELPEQLLGFLCIERLVPVSTNPLYASALPNVMRLLLASFLIAASNAPKRLVAF